MDGGSLTLANEENNRATPNDVGKTGSRDTDADSAVAEAATTTPASNLPSFSSRIWDRPNVPILDANGLVNLSSLSHFFETNRQVDIGFRRRHALIVYLMEGLEKAYFAYAQQNLPAELELLQVLSADEFEPHVWRAFLSLHLGFDYMFSCDTPVNNLRHYAVHRGAYDTNLIHAVVTQALRVRDYNFVKNIDTIIGVFYTDATSSHINADADDEKEAHYLFWTINDEDRRLVDDLLWPSNRPIETMHQLLDKVQNLGEISSFKFCQRYLPQVLVQLDCNAGERFELSVWQRVITSDMNWSETNHPEAMALRETIMRRLKIEYGAPAAKVDTTAMVDTVDGTDIPANVDPAAQMDIMANIDTIGKVDTIALRNHAAHRDAFVFNGLGAFTEEGLPFRLIRHVIRYVRVLGDEPTATQIEQLRTETLALLLRKQQAWMDPTEHPGQDWRGLLDRAENDYRAWGGRNDYFRERGIDIKPIQNLYIRSTDRFYSLWESNRATDPSDDQPLVQPTSPEPAIIDQDALPDAGDYSSGRGSSSQGWSDSPQDQQAPDTSSDREEDVDMVDDDQDASACPEDEEHMSQLDSTEQAQQSEWDDMDWSGQQDPTPSWSTEEELRSHDPDAVVWPEDDEYAGQIDAVEQVDQGLEVQVDEAEDQADDQADEYDGQAETAPRDDAAEEGATVVSRHDGHEGGEEGPSDEKSEIV
ncbi:MAG: hypothetical protein LQ346_007597 [Caloplaca aetnensis]|nr:MAG: hypothetical protein LQ346_007597 [Caloplaca aetnensis]